MSSPLTLDSGTEAQQLDLDIGHRAADAESNLVRTLENERVVRENKDNKYVVKLKNRPVCTLDKLDVSGLSNHKPRPSDKKPATRSQ